MRLICCFLLIAIRGLASDPKYPISEIPEELKKGVNAVVREDKMVYTINSRSTATAYTHVVISIFNNNGKGFAEETIGYSKLSKITMFKANVYGPEGNLIRKVKSSEIEDGSAFDRFSLYSDNRYKSVNVAQSVYPYTVEFEYEVEYKYLYSIEGTYLIPGEKISVQHASYELIFPEELRPRYKMLNVDQQPKKSNPAKGVESLSWSFENLKPITIEPYGPGPSEVIPHILAAPSLFQYEGYPGDMSSWNQYGKWRRSILEGRDEISEETKAKVISLTKGLPTTEQKVKVLYEYLQGKTRYVSISEGVGGIQPFKASEVDQTGYGDCKALSNYMVALLKQADVKGYYCAVRAGENEDETMLDFPSHQTNHVIVAVPNGTDTLWLECTSQTSPFAYSGKFTGDRKALMVKEDGAVWVNTPKYPEELNVQSRTADVTIATTGDASATIKTIYSGLQYETDGLDFYLNNQYDKQKKWVLETTDIPVFDVTSFKFEDKKGKIPTAIVTLNLSLKRFANVSGKRLMLTPNLMNRNSFIPGKNESRKTDIVRNFGFVDYDTIRYHIPSEIYPEILPQPTKISSKFGEYESSYTLDQGLVVYTRRIKINKGRFPASTYQEFIDFYKSINRADNAKLVFLNKT